MPQDHTPAPAMRIALRALPTPLLQRMIDVLVRRKRIAPRKTCAACASGIQSFFVTLSVCLLQS